MPKSQRIVWTALPNGFEGTTLKLSVFVSPRLYNNTDTQLSDYPDFVSWAKRAAAVNFEVEFKGGPKLKANVVSGTPDNDLWSTIFKPVTFVRAYKFQEHHKRVIRTYPVADVMGFLKGLYSAAGDQSPTNLPKLSSNSTVAQGFNLNDLFNKLGGLRDRRADYERLMDGVLNRQTVKAFDPNLSQGLTREQFAFMQVDFFYDRKRNKNLKEEQAHPKPTPKRLPKPKLDFHQMLSGLGDYPGVERKIGIVIDLEVPAGTAAQLATLLAAHSIRVRPEWTSPASPFNNDFAPWTKILAGKFIAEPNPNSDLRGGMLKLADANGRFSSDSKANYDLLQLDADGGSLKTLDFASNMRRFLSNPRAYNASDDGGLPAFRTSGLALVKRGRAFKLANDLQQTVPNNQAVENSASSVDMNLPVLFYADDLVRGYRVDILDQTMGATAGWRSLCKRVGTYSFPNSSQPQLRIEDEGYVKGASASSTVGGDSDSDLYLHETMFQWEGWSLSATRPGKTIIAESYDSNGNPLPQQNEKVEYSPNSAKGIDGVNIETSFGPQPGTLPRLRFGHTYRMRVRAADIAGNSLPADSKDATQASEQHSFSRFDPVVPPALLLRERVTDGEAVERMVIRSNYEQTAADYADSPRTKEAIKNKDYQYHKDNERHVAPPKTSQQMAELHGKFDEFIGYDAATDTKKNYDRGYKLALKETGTFLDTKVYDPKTDTTTDVNGIELVTPKSVPVTPELATLPLNPPGRALTAGQYVIHKEENLMLPYLPDPFSRGTAFLGLPHLTGAGPLASDPGAVKVQLQSLNPNEQNQKFSVLKVQFDGAWPDATPFRIRIAEGSGEPVWKNHVLTVFLQKAEVARVRFSSYLNKDDLVQMGIWSWLTKQTMLEPYAIAGQHWMFTPFRRLELVHAVQQPLKEPKFYKMQTNKLKLGDTFADFQGNIDLSVKSTSKIEVRGTWKEWQDSLSEPGPRQLSLEGNAFELKIEEKSDDIYNVDSTGTAKSYHEFHDTKYRAVDYHIIATTRFREYFPVEITKRTELITRVSKPQTFKVLNSARPAAPRVLYIVPTFKWDPAPSETGDRKHEWRTPQAERADLGSLSAAPQRVGRPTRVLESRRLGNGLRVYLERPWYSSGDEEKLGVILREFPNIPPNDPLKPFATQWGTDPIWASPLPTSFPKATDFKLAKVVQAGLTLDEVPNVKVGAVGHDVEYDPERKLWFCDIEIDTGKSYFPFVRLGLARFQPNSLPDAHLSRVVLADFAQLTPDRAASVSFDSPNSLSVTVSGFGYRTSSFEAEAANPNNIASPQVHGNKMRISLEAQRFGTDLGWVPVPRSEVILSPTDAAGGLTVWKGKMELSASMGNTRLRLVIREYETFIGGPEAHIEERVVYADVLEFQNTSLQLG